MERPPEGRRDTKPHCHLGEGRPRCRGAEDERHASEHAKDSATGAAARDIPRTYAYGCAMGDALRDKLAPIYRPLMGELFDRPEVQEPRATCNDCAMCDKGSGGPGVMDYFKPDLKCCTYLPNLPNYLVGAIFAEGPSMAEGQKRLRARLAARTAVSPCWVGPPRKYLMMMMASRGTNSFGRAKTLLCPYYDGSKADACTIWKHRESVCSTFFCKYIQGKIGCEFWSGLKAYLEHVEVKLSHWAMAQVDPTLVEPKPGRLRLTAEDIDELPPKAADYEALWQGWVGREEEFYVACFEKVRAMSREEFVRVVESTPEVAGSLTGLKMKWDALVSTDLPKYLVRNPKMMTTPLETSVVITTYNLNDSFAMEKDLYDVLALLEPDKTLDENLTSLAKDHGIELAPELMHHLYVHGVLVPPSKKRNATVCEVPKKS